MKIAIITETFLPSTDGVVTRLCASIKWLQDNGHQVSVIAPDLGTQEYMGAKVLGVPAGKFFLYQDKRLSLPSRKVRKYLQEFQPDIVHVVNPVLLGAAGIYYSKKLGLPLIASYHTNVPQYARHYHLPMLEPFLWWYIKTLHNQAQLNLCTSRTVQRELEQKGLRNVHLWMRGVAVERFGPKFFNSSMRELLTNGQSDKTLLLYVGRLAPEKEIEKLRDVLNASQGICLAIVGDGPCRASLEEYFQGTNTVFTGFMHGEQLSQAYASSDIFVFPSTTETLGLVLLEAMASGLPVVAADSGPTREQVEYGVTGVLYNPQVPSKLTEAVLMLKELKVRSLMADNAYNVGSSFSWVKPSEQLVEFYEQVVANFGLKSDVAV